MKITFQILGMVVAILTTTTSVTAQWTQTNGPFGGLVRALFLNDSTIYASQENVCRLTNYGSSWIRSGPGSVSSFAVTHSKAGTTNLFAGTLLDGVFLSTDEGISWFPVNSGLTDLHVFFLTVSDTGLFAGTSGGLFLSTDNGASWNAKSNVMVNDKITCLAAVDTILFAGTQSNGVFLSTDNGTSWVDDNTGLSSYNNPESYKYINFLVVDDTNIFAGTGGDGIYRSSRKGRSWTHITSEVDRFGVTAFANKYSETGRTLYFAAPFRNNAFLLSSDYGASWDTANIGLYSGDVLALAATETSLFAGTRYGGVFQSTTNGATWTESNYGMWLHVNSLAVIDTNLFAGTNDAGVFLSSNNGSSWNLTGFMDYVTAITVTNDTGSGEMNLFAANYDHGVFFSTNAGARWDTVGSRLTNKHIFSLASKGKIVYAGTVGWGAFRSSDMGVSWTQVNIGFTNDTVWALASNDSCIFAGTMGGLFVSYDSGSSWSRTNYDSREPFPGTQESINFSSSWPLTASGTSVFVKNELNLQESTDNGETWTTVEGISMAKAGANDFITSRTQKVEGISLNLTDIYSLAASKNFLYAGTSSGIWKNSLSNVTAVRNSGQMIPVAYKLEQNYPNPFNPSTTIRYQLPGSSYVVLKVFDVLGREVVTLVKRQQRAGSHSVQFNATTLTSGVYFYRLEAGTYRHTRKLLVLK